MLSEGSSVKGNPEHKQPSGPCIKGSAKISWRVQNQVVHEQKIKHPLISTLQVSSKSPIENISSQTHPSLSDHIYGLMWSSSLKL